MNEHDSLSALLKTWRHQPSDEPGFNRGVWSRLQAEPATTNTGFFGKFLAFPAVARWAMPLAASFVLALSLVFGSGAAFAYDTLTRNDRMATEYARSIDPLQMTILTPHSHP